MCVRMQSYNHTILIFYTHNRPWSWCEWYYGNFHGIFKTPDDSGDDSSANDESDDEIEAVDLRRVQSTFKNAFQRKRSNPDLELPVAGSSVIIPANVPQENVKKNEEKRTRIEENTRQREEEQEQIRLEAVEKYNSGTLKPTFSASPDSRVRTFESFESDTLVADQIEGHFAEELAYVRRSVSEIVKSSSSESGSEDRIDPVVSDDSENQNLNPSGMEACELEQKAPVTVELSTISAEDIWELFKNSKFRGGMLARSLFIAAKAVQPDQCTPWAGHTTIGTKKKEVADQRSSFLMWAKSAKFVLDWIRLEIYKIVSMKPFTYRSFTATHALAPKHSHTAQSKLESVQASDDTMARVAHLACNPESRIMLNMIFGAKDRQIIDSNDLQPAVLWQDLATMHVNRAQWQIQQMQVPQLQTATSSGFVSKIDVTNVPVIGVSGDCVREVFAQLKTWYLAVATAVFGKTGVNSTGEDFYGKVWSNYINGPYLYFPRKEVAMYVFKLWTETNKDDALPKYCIKELHPEAQVRLGVMMDNCKDARKPFTLPVTPRSSSLIFGSPSGSQTSTTKSTLEDSITSFISFKLRKEMQDEERLTLSTGHDLVPMLEVPKPNAEFSELLKTHGLLSVWDSGTAYILCSLAVTICNKTHAF